MLQPDAIACTDAVEEPECVAIAAEQHVLAVVHALACCRIGERRRAATERRTRFEHEHARAVFSKAGRGGKPRAPAADDDAVADQRANMARAHRRSAINARYGRGTRILRLNTS